MDNGGPRHLAYLLRLWRAGNGEHVIWRASLERAYTGERRAFGSLAALFAYLEAQTLSPSQRDAPVEGASVPPEGKP